MRLSAAESTAGLARPTRGDFREDSAARRELSAERCRDWTAGLHHVGQEPIHDILLKDAEVPIGQHVHLERLQLQAQTIRHIAQRQFAMIRQAGLGADGGELRQYDFDLISGILILPGLDLRQRGLDARARMPVCVFSLHRAGINVRASRSRNSPTSVTTPTACPVPRSLTLVATAGLISTHTILTQLGSMLPTAIECSIDPRHRTSPAPRNCSA